MQSIRHRRVLFLCLTLNFVLASTDIIPLKFYDTIAPAEQTPIGDILI